MKLSKKWLGDYVKDLPSPKVLADGLTMSGSKAETVEEIGNIAQKVVIGKCVEIKRHENSEKLNVAQINIGKETVQIVTAAANVYENAILPVVLDGGVVVRDDEPFKIKKTKMRGVESAGMMCSFEELGFVQADFPNASSDGIWLLNEEPEFANIDLEAKLGFEVKEVLSLIDYSIDFEITNNRPDCLSVLGLAREVWATFKDTDKPFQPTSPKFNGIDGDVRLAVSIKEPKLCSRYTAAVVKNVKIKPSPKFIRERLKASGVRPINNFVDITNFVMLEYGHPMHAFDKRYVEGDEIIVRLAENGEKITLLDGETRTLTPETLIIADAKKPIAVAGVMGGEYSGILPGTTEVIFESACFDGVSVRRTAKRIGRRTDASSRFEKELDPSNAYDALIRALELVEQLGAGEVVKTIIDVDKSAQKDRSVKFDANRINEILGSDITENEQLKILKRLGFEYDEKNSTVTPPSVRIDIKLDCDLAEEVARIYGYNNIKSKPLPFATNSAVYPEEVFAKKIRNAAFAAGFYETVTSNFASYSLNEKSNLNSEESVVISNPFGAETELLRISTLTSTLLTLQTAKGKGKFFELGRVYKKGNGKLPDESQELCLGADETDFYTFKGYVENILAEAGLAYNINYSASDGIIKPSTKQTFHSGRCAQIFVEVNFGDIANPENEIGIFGEIHPLVAENFDLKNRIYIAIINLDKLFELKQKSKEKLFKPLPKYPTLTRDLSLVCDDELLCGDILRQIRQSGGKILESVKLFDTFKGGNLPENKKALAFNLIFRKHDGTLSDTDADTAISKILKNLGKLNIELRK